MRLRLVMGCLLVGALGCNSQPYKLAPVSGKVTLNGKPLANAYVHFAPIASKDNDSPGPTSHGKTDADGKYTLIVDPEHSGAVVGKSRVFISLHKGGGGGDDQPDAGGAKGVKEVIPSRYNQQTTLVHEVPPGGTDEANFDLKAP